MIATIAVVFLPLFVPTVGVQRHAHLPLMPCRPAATPACQPMLGLLAGRQPHQQAMSCLAPCASVVPVLLLQVVDRTILVLQNVVLLVFLAVLLCECCCC